MAIDVDDLDGLGVLVTRPEAQGKTLCEYIDEANGRATCMPTLEIVSPPEADVARLGKADLTGYTCAIFISRNAADWAVKLIPNLAEQLENVNVAAIGTGTVSALSAHGIAVDLCPDSRQSAEGLLAMDPLMDVMDRKVAIIRGEGGREILRDELTERGAETDYFEVYRREMPKVDAEQLVNTWDDNIDVTLLTSLDSFENLKQILGEAGCEKLKNTQIIVASGRIGDRVKEFGCRDIINAGGAGDRAILGALEDIAAERAEEDD